MEEEEKVFGFFVFLARGKTFLFVFTGRGYVLIFRNLNQQYLPDGFFSFQDRDVSRDTYCVTCKTDPFPIIPFCAMHWVFKYSVQKVIDIKFLPGKTGAGVSSFFFSVLENKLLRPKTMSPLFAVSLSSSSYICTLLVLPPSLQYPNSLFGPSRPLASESGEDREEEEEPHYDN